MQQVNSEQVQVQAGALLLSLSHVLMMFFGLSAQTRLQGADSTAQFCVEA